MQQDLKPRTRPAILMTSLSLALAIAFVTLGLERPFWRFHQIHNREQRAVVAVRDHVPAFQKWGTKLYTLPYLEKYYQRVYYLTQYPGHNKKQEFIDSLTLALTEYQQVDLLLLSHGNSMYQWVVEIPEPLRKNLRLVYNTGCNNAWQNQYWLRLGADTYVGHDGTQGALFYFFFLRRWTLDYPLDQVINDSNQVMRKVIAQEQNIPGIRSLNPELTDISHDGICFGNCNIKISD